MAKLTQFEKSMYADNRDLAADIGMFFTQSEDKRITVAVMYNDKIGGFIRVYVAYCGNETPKRKRGINAVMTRYIQDNYILTPKGCFDLEWAALYILDAIQDSYS